MAPRRGGMTATGASRAGMTLVELLAAMAIFLGLAGMVLQVLGGGLDLWSSGERTRDESEQASALLDRISAELRHAVAVDGGAGEPRIKFLCDTISLDTDGDATRDFRAQRLLFVRRLTEERVHRPLFLAGTHEQGEVPWIGAIDSQDALFQPTEGLVEEALVVQPDLRAGYEGRCVLWRALRSPIGGEESFFANALRDDGGLDRAPLEPMAENVLLFALGFLEETTEDPTALPGDARGPQFVWDSTRGILDAGDGFNGFLHARGKASLADPDDDLFPVAVRITVIVAPPPDEGAMAEITNDLPASGGSVRAELMNGRVLRQYGEAARLVKLGHEWVKAAESDGSSLFITQRGALGTAASAHAAGTKVLVGKRFERIVRLPCGRADLVSRDLDRGGRR